ncbi:MAG: tetratricopeptide repeat protein [Gammaproteobacteria bacterium]|nr:tetratricopeptide repeat protein [Gammaproteobacteria bacterium]
MKVLNNRAQAVRALTAVGLGVLIAAGVFALAEAVLTLAGVAPLSRAADPYVGFDAQHPVFVPVADGDPKMMRTAPSKERFFNVQHFAARKPANTYRIFCLGGSTTYGRPYNDTTSFCGWLRVLLPAVDATRQWEVINAGGISYASYRLTHVARDLQRFAPDLFLIYTGHNEFLERRTYQNILDKPYAVREADAILSHTRVYSGLKRLLDPLLFAPRDVVQLSGEVDAVLDTVGPEAYTRDDELKAQVHAQFAANLHRLVDIAQGARAVSLFITPASNLKDCSPFKSEHRDGLSDDQRRAWRTAFDSGTRFERRGDWKAAASAYRQALVIDTRHAQTHYRLGRSLLAAGEADGAHAAFVHALDEDVCPLRAHSLVPDLMRKVAAARDVPVADFAARLAEVSRKNLGHTAPGEEFFLDHVHPTIRGHRLIALTVIDELQRLGLVKPAADWGEARIAAVTEQLEGSLDRAAHGVALRNLAKVLSWAGKIEDAARVAQRAVDLLGDDAESRFVLGNHALEREAWRSAVDHYQRAVELDPRYVKAYTNLGIAWARLGRYREAADAYRRTLKLDPTHANAHYNLGNALKKAGELGAAITHYRLALEQRPDDQDARYNLALALRQVGDLLAARHEYEKLLVAHPTDAAAHTDLEALQREIAETHSGGSPAQRYEVGAIKWDIDSADAHHGGGIDPRQ